MTLLKWYVGKYELASGIIISISKHDSQLKVQVTGNRELPIFAKSKSVFYYKVEQAQLSFNKNKNWVVESMTLLQYDTRKVQDLKISAREVWLHLRVSQFVCPTCNRYFLDIPKWIMPSKSYTKRQAKWIFELCKQQAFTQVGALVNLSNKTVERLFYEMAEKLINLPKRYAQVRKLGIDEISHRKGKKDYACVLTDLERGIELDVLPDRKKETLKAHFQSLGIDFCNQIEVVCCDIWKTYINVVKECFPNAEIVIDRFHVVKAINDVLDFLRKSVRREF